MTVNEAFGSLADIVAAMQPEKIATLKASPEMSERVTELTMRKKNGSISDSENAELERFLGLDLFISLAKARANAILRQ